jgi:hypothetical protein
MSIEEKIESTIASYTKHLEDWFNADIEMEDVDNVSQMFDDDWEIVNRNIPGFTGDKQSFITHMKTLYGRHKDDRITYYFSDLKMKNLGDNFYLTTFVQGYEFSKKNNKWPMTAILKFDEYKDEMTFYYVHE